MCPPKKISLRSSHGSGFVRRPLVNHCGPVMANGATASWQPMRRPRQLVLSWSRSISVSLAGHAFGPLTKPWQCELYWSETAFGGSGISNVLPLHRPGKLSRSERSWRAVYCFCVAQRSEKLLAMKIKSAVAALSAAHAASCVSRAAALCRLSSVEKGSFSHPERCCR